MAYIHRMKSGGWRAEVNRAGVRKSNVLPTKAAAVAWATQLEGDVLAKRRGQTVRRSLRQAIERYRDEVTPHKPGRRWETIRLNFYLGPDGGLPFVEKWLEEVTPDDFGRWRDRRLLGVKGSTVNRDFNLLSAVLTTAREEWGWMHSAPLKKARRPSEGQPRTRVIRWTEVRRMLRELGWRRGAPPATKSAEVGHAFLVALHTAMRASEVLKAQPAGTVARLYETKNGEARDVPLSPRAQRLVALCPRYTVDSAGMDALFRKARLRAGLEGFTFHDSRGTALTRMARKVDVLTLARISGHKDLNILMRTYYRERSESIAERLR